MTREDVLSGVKFKWKSGVYTANPDDKGAELGGSLLLCIGNAQIYECNVSSFGPYAMHWYTYVMGRHIKGRISYKHLEPHIEAPEPAAKLSTQLDLDQVHELIDAEINRRRN